ncbi:MAG: XdhC family protein [Porticoccaceae bacterium]|nr:XdhC family protein [Porticoccaceae bacterium]MDG1311467.1 XdhC family protein [Porticoccaceae bacterium]
MISNNDFPQLLKLWAAERDDHDWVLGTVYKTTGPSYRKAGAFMLFNSLGQQFGLLSGGCLESDIQRHAKAVMASGRPNTICYDGSDEDDISFQFGIGCGGTVYILLQPITAQNNYLQLESLAACLARREHSIYLQRIHGETAEAQFVGETDQENSLYMQIVAQLEGAKSLLVTLDGADKPGEYLATMIKPPIHLLVVGGGVDARPLVSMASYLGWDISLCDPRPANGRREHFMQAANILDCPIGLLPQHELFGTFDGAVLMSHNLQMDAEALAVLQTSSVDYLALLGPESRKAAVLELAGLGDTKLNLPVAGPAGLNLGGELPESLALSILAQCHAALYKADAQAFCDLPL